MSKILSIFLNVIKMSCPPLALSGCFLMPDLEQVFVDELRIKNNQETPIIYCNEFDATSCFKVIQSGGTESVMFYSHVDSDEENSEAFDRQKIKICGKVLDIKMIRTVSPVVKYDKAHSEIIINRAVSDKFCQ